MASRSRRLGRTRPTCITAFTSNQQKVSTTHGIFSLAAHDQKQPGNHIPPQKSARARIRLYEASQSTPGVWGKDRHRLVESLTRAAFNKVDQIEAISRHCTSRDSRTRDFLRLLWIDMAGPLEWRSASAVRWTFDPCDRDGGKRKEEAIDFYRVSCHFPVRTDIPS